MTITRRWAGATALALLLTGGVAAGTAVYAQGPGGPGGGPGFAGRHGGAGFGMFRGLGLGPLDLNDAQRQQVRTILQGQRDAFKEIGQRIGAARKNLNDAVTAPTVDEGTIRARSAELAAAEADAAVLRAKVHSEVWAVLTPDQQQKAADMKAKMAARMEQWRQLRQQRQQQQQQQQQ